MESEQPDGDVLARLVAHTTKVLEEPTKQDSLKEVALKYCRRAKIEVPQVLTTFNPSVLSIPYLYPHVLQQERLVALQNIQAYVRGSFNQPFLVEEYCSLVYMLASTIALFGEMNDDIAAAKQKTPMALYETIEPLIKTLDSKLLYLRGKKKGFTPGEVATIGEQVASASPSDKKLANGRKAGRDDEERLKKKKPRR